MSESNASHRRRYLHLGIAVMLLTLLIQADARVAGPQLPTNESSKNSGPNVPRLAAVNGGSANAGVAANPTQPFRRVGSSVIRDVSPPLRDIAPIPPKAGPAVREMPEVEQAAK